MKRIFFIFLMSAIGFACVSNLDAAVTITKAEPVATARTTSSNTGGSLVPNVIGLVTGVMAMNQQMKSLGAECEPSTSDIEFVSNMMREYYKTGASVEIRGASPCEGANTFQRSAQEAEMTTGMTACFDTWRGVGNDGMVWVGAPRATKASICKKAGGIGCAQREMIVVSNVYDMFNLIDFGPEDYLPGEGTRAARLLSLVEQCSTSKLSARKRSMWGDFLVTTAGGLGTTTGTAGTMQGVNQILQAGGGSPLGSIGGIGQMLLPSLTK
ncbi:MAG: hypothetical protein FWF34_02460 [Alphaproteobacteria bacterium]|nr:hypothetical protein [Alphaproteobacteria bacterium]MCL2890093.1 hypothetical protein [Alphaproteobacteria bacterium]